MKTEEVLERDSLRSVIYNKQVDVRSMALNDASAALDNALEVLRLHKDTIGGREMAVTITELEKVVAYFQTWVGKH